MKRLLLIFLLILSAIGLQNLPTSHGSDRDIGKVTSMSPTKGYGGAISIIATNIPLASEIWLATEPPVKLNVASVKTLDTTELEFTFSLPESLNPAVYRIYLDPMVKPIHMIRAGEYTLLDKKQKADVTPEGPVVGPSIGGQTSPNGGRPGAPPPISGPPSVSPPIDRLADLPVEKPILGKPGELPPPKPPEPPIVPIETPPSIFGKDLFSENSTIMYVIDISGSMSSGVGTITDEDGKTKEHATRLDRAKAQLIKSIISLPKNFRFNVNSFDCGVYGWQIFLQVASEQNKKSAIQWIKDLAPQGATGTGPAMAYALKVKECKLFVLLTDGAPNCGAGDGSGWPACIESHRDMVRSHNTQKATINVFGINAVSEFKQFCMNIAGDSCGSYQDVE